MKLIIDIPKEFETDYKGDKFKDFFSRVLCDIEKGVLCGNYEKETAEMFLKAFDESVTMDNIVEKLEEAKEKAQNEMEECIFKGLPYHDSTEGKVIGIITSINIVKQEINNGLE
jgi:hypothetical protein